MKMASAAKWVRRKGNSLVPMVLPRVVADNHRHVRGAEGFIPSFAIRRTETISRTAICHQSGLPN
jgi:hypothetical protein